MRETWVQSLGWEDPLEKGTATHSSILVWRIPWTEELLGAVEDHGFERACLKMNPRQVGCEGKAGRERDDTI